MNKYILATFFIAVNTSAIFGQHDNLSATEIVQRAIDSSGGDRKLDSINSADFVVQLITAEHDSISLAVKRTAFKKYFISTLSTTHENSTTIYNNGRAVIIKNEFVQQIADPLQLESLFLDCYHSVDYGYKKLGYKLTRIADDKFEQFDCYRVIAESPLGKKTVNFYDKKAGKLLMIIYPDQTRTVFVEYFKNEGISYPIVSLILDKAGKIAKSTLTQADYDGNIDTGWFHIPATGTYNAPDSIKTGKYKYSDGIKNLSVARDNANEVDFGKTDSVKYLVKWLTHSDYIVFRLKNRNAAPSNDNIEYIRHRIIGWNGNKYYSHFITSGNVGGSAVFKKEDRP